MEKKTRASWEEVGRLSGKREKGSKTKEGNGANLLSRKDFGYDVRETKRRETSWAKRPSWNIWETREGIG